MMQMVDLLLHLFFPANCVLCEKALTQKDERAVCLKCMKALSQKEEEVCQLCQHPLFHGECTACQKNSFSFRQHRAIGVNEGLMQDFLYDFKFNRKKTHARALIRAILEKESEYIADHDAVVPVTIAKAAYFERDFCQVSEVFRPIAHKLKVDWCPAIEKKYSPSQAQHLKNLSLRKTEIAEQFAYIQKHRGKLDDKKVLIVDDIMTSGSTINHFCRLIQENNTNVELNALTLARSLLYPEIRKDILSAD